LALDEFAGKRRLAQLVGLAQLHRWTFDLPNSGNQFTCEKIDDLSGDFPRLDERFALNPYRDGYFAASEKRDEVAESLSRFA
jgi:carotenoid cleavage dioxygenase-like enzyme